MAVQVVKDLLQWRRLLLLTPEQTSNPHKMLDYKAVLTRQMIIAALQQQRTQVLAGAEKRDSLLRILKGQEEP